MHSPKFAMVKRYYKLGMWDKARVRNAEEYEEIVGEAYEEEPAE